MNTLQNIFLVVLKYKINFHDADDGDCYAGDGTRIIKAFLNIKDANDLAEKMNPIISAAEKETTIFPVQKNNREVKKELGFTLDNIDDGYGFELIVEEIEMA